MPRTLNRGPQGGTTLPGGRVNIYHAQLTNPVSPVPSAGDMYYNTAIREWMYYDNIRAKWLSLATHTLQVGRSGTVPPGTYFRGINGMLLDGVNRSIPVPQGTLVGIGAIKTDGGTSTIEVVVNTVPIASLILAGAGNVSNFFVDADFAAGNLAVRNSAGSPATISNCQVTLWYKRRT